MGLFGKSNAQKDAEARQVAKQFKQESQGAHTVMNGIAGVVGIFHPLVGMGVKALDWAASNEEREAFEEDYRKKAQRRKGESERRFRDRVNREIKAIKQEMGWTDL